jgi:hypothetical protein
MAVGYFWEVAKLKKPGADKMEDWIIFSQREGQYYVAGRYAAFAGLVPTTGNQFHHAVELFLKGGLSKNGLSLANLKKLGHDLPEIWAMFTALRTFGILT